MQNLSFKETTKKASAYKEDQYLPFKLTIREDGVLVGNPIQLDYLDNPNGLGESEKIYPREETSLEELPKREFIYSVGARYYNKQLFSYNLILWAPDENIAYDLAKEFLETSLPKKVEALDISNIENIMSLIQFN